MPHIDVDYSSNLEGRVDVAAFVRTVHEAALSTGVFKLPAVRTRAQKRTIYVIADGHPDNAFVTITVRIGHGRDEVTRRRIGQMMFDAIRAYLAPVFDASPLAISLEVQEINPAFSFKQNNLHSIVPERAAAQEPVG